MHFTAAALALALAGTASAHTLMFGVSINGVDQGDGKNKYIRSPPNNNPVKDLSSPDLVCNVNGGKAVDSFVQAAGGDKVTFEWFHNTRGDDIIDLSHKGPIITWIAPFTTSNGAEAIWTKIAEDGFANGKWAVEKLVANKGKVDFSLPAGLAAGKYLVRQEIIAHHESDAAFNANPARGAQFYPSCVQFEVAGSGNVVPSQNFDFNTGYTYSDKGIVFNLYAPFSSYPIPGPPVFTGGSSSGGGGSGGGGAPVPRPGGPGGPGANATAPAVRPPPHQTTLLTSARQPSLITKTITIRPTGSCRGHGHN